MKRLSRIVVYTLIVSMLMCIMAIDTLADESEAITVSLRIEGVKENIYHNKEIKIPEGSTVRDLITQVNAAAGSPKIKVTDSTYGAYISEIDGIAEFAYGGMTGWSYRVNDTAPPVGISQYELKDKDSIIVFYGDPFGVGMQYPVATLSKLFSEGVIKFTSIDTEYNENWTPLTVEKPVAGATVMFRWDTYVTDDKGEIKVTNKTGVSGFRSMQIERYEEGTGVPTVLRYAPDYEIYVPFADTPHDNSHEWYENAVRFCVREELAYGTDLAANLFEPMRNMTMTQLVTVLARIGGVDADLTTGESWYVAPLSWAIANKVLPAEGPAAGEEIGVLYELTSGINVTREEFIYMFYITVGLVGGHDMEARADIKGAVDYDDIKVDYHEAVSWAVASGIIGGTNPYALTISPAMEVNRATVCQMLYNYYT